jgi:hypothetical protein
VRSSAAVELTPYLLALVSSLRPVSYAVIAVYSIAQVIDAMIAAV